MDIDLLGLLLLLLLLLGCWRCSLETSAH